MLPFSVCPRRRQRYGCLPTVVKLTWVSFRDPLAFLWGHALVRLVSNSSLFFFLSHLKKIYIFRWKFFISSKYQWIETIVFIMIKYIFLCVNVESIYKNTRDYLILEYYIYSYSFMWYLNILFNNFLRHMSILI